MGRRVAVATVAGLTLIDVTLASPFGRLDAPAVRGFGLNPILEHPAMTIHPPLLYAGLADGGRRGVRRRGRSILAVAPRRPWLLSTIGLLTLAMTLGAIWSYMEQGWGGYWAWDPVENTSLVVWLAAIVAVHGAPLANAGWMSTAYVAAPWVLGHRRRRRSCAPGSARRSTASPSSAASVGRWSRWSRHVAGRGRGRPPRHRADRRPTPTGRGGVAIRS